MRRMWIRRRWSSAKRSGTNGSRQSEGGWKDCSSPRRHDTPRRHVWQSTPEAVGPSNRAHLIGQGRQIVAGSAEGLPFAAGEGARSPFQQEVRPNRSRRHLPTLRALPGVQRGEPLAGRKAAKRSFSTALSPDALHPPTHPSRRRSPPNPEPGPALPGVRRPWPWSRPWSWATYPNNRPIRGVQRGVPYCSTPLSPDAPILRGIAASNAC